MTTVNQNYFAGSAFDKIEAQLGPAAQRAAPGSGTTVGADGAMYVNPGKADWGRTSATELLGDLTRYQWEDWKTRFAPYITQLADIATDTQRPEASAQRAMETVGTSFEGARKGLELQESRQGIALTDQQRQSRERMLGLAEAGAKANAANTTRNAVRDQQQQILAGGAGLTLPTDPQYPSA